MRLCVTIVLLLFLLACSADGRRVKYKVIPPARLKAIIDQNRKSQIPVKAEQASERSRSFIHRQKQKTYSNKPLESVTVFYPRRSDSIRLKNIESLRNSEIRADFSEPLNNGLLQKQGGDTLFQSIITLSSDRVLKIGFDNDIFDYTDQFYTNGIRFDYIGPAISGNPVKVFLLPYWGKAKNYYGLTLIQNLYTPSTTKIGGILYGDRPYSAYLYLGNFKITNDEVHHFRQTSELDLGIIGPFSMGGSVQDLFHKYVPSNNEPLGWDYQIRTDAVINYNFALEKGVINTEHAQMTVTGTGSLGTLYTNFGGSFSLRLGWFNDYFSDLGIRKRSELKASGKRVAQYFFTVQGGTRFVAYDATLEGGLINRSSPYTLPSSAIANIVMQSSVGFTITYGGIGLELEQTILSPEFSYKWWHAWGHIGLMFAL